MAEGVRAEDGVQHRGERAGLARTRRAEDGEVLAQQVVGDQEGRQAAVLVQGADAQVGSLRALVDLLQFFAAGGVDAIAEAGIVGDAAQQVETGRRLPGGALRERKSGGEGELWSVRVHPGGRRNIEKNTT